MKPLAKQFFALASKYQVTYVREGHSVNEEKQRLNALLWGDQPSDF